MKNYVLSKQTFDVFCEKEGNKHIASLSALKGLQKLILRYKVTKVLELGIGIGTIPYFLSRLAAEEGIKIEYTGTEANDYCIQQFIKNLPPDNHNFSFRYYANLLLVPLETYGLIIIDGSDNNFEHLTEYCDEKTILFIEGDRKPQREAILKMFTKDPISFYSAISNKKNEPNSPFPPDRFGKGYTVFFLNPDLQKKIFKFHNKVLTAVKYRLRPLLKIKLT